jgi:predicted nucleotidyltransferase
MPYTIEQIKEKIKPIAEKYSIPAVYLFGSYARGEATANSDVDLLFLLKNSKIRGLKIGALHNDLEEVFPPLVDKPYGFDMLELNSLDIENEFNHDNRYKPIYKNAIEEGVKIYGN